jgi:hypothetical protein
VDHRNQAVLRTAEAVVRHTAEAVVRSPVAADRTAAVAGSPLVKEERRTAAAAAGSQEAGLLRQPGL